MYRYADVWYLRRMPYSAAKRRALYQANKTARPPVKYPKRRCINCDAKYPLTRKGRKFCGAQCRTEYNHFGGAFGPLKKTLTRLVQKLTREDIRNVRTELIQEFNKQLGAMGEMLREFAQDAERMKRHVRELQARVESIRPAELNRADR